jgi:Flp pilus assembly protein TadG
MNTDFIKSFAHGQIGPLHREFTLIAKVIKAFFKGAMLESRCFGAGADMVTHWRRLSKRRRLRACRAGDIAPIAALAFLILTPLMAVAIDTSQTWAAKRGLQDALDAALLAVARERPENQSDIDAIAAAYVASNLSDRYGATITTLSIRRIDDGHYTGTATADVTTIFAGIFGMDTMQAGAEGDVKVDRSKLDVVLSLDTTGSMAGTRIAGLKTAARDFVDTMLDDNPEAVRIGIVPFARYVNIGMMHRNEPGFAIPADSRVCRMEWQTEYFNCTNCTSTEVTGTCYNDGVPYACSWTDQRCDCETRSVEREVCTDTIWHGCVGSRAAPLNTQDDNANIAIPGVMNRTCGTALRRLTNDASRLRDTIDDLDVGNETYLPVGLSMGWAADSGPLRPAIPRWASATGSDMDFGQFVVKAAAGVPRWTSASLARAR